MCGIFGMYLQRPLRDDDIRAGMDGVRQLRHRGPDNNAWFADRERGIFIGHTRLSIIDVSHRSDQPMKRRGAVLAYNGEIYNYKELRDELKAHDAVFRTSGDTEVLLEAWLRWGPECLDRLDGMFAFALYQEPHLYLATDPFGEKPMYWARTGEGLYFSSEVGPLTRLLRPEAQWTARDVVAFLSLGFVPVPATGYQGLNRMPPGAVIAYANRQPLATRRYWTPPVPEVRRGKVQHLSERDLDQVVETLVTSLKRRLRADVPAVVFLSSGVDSALVAALAAKEVRYPIPALTVRFRDRTVADESAAAAAIARHLGLQHTVVDSRELPIDNTPASVRWLYGEALDNLTVFPAYQMSLTAVSQAKVALTGMGGDEVFYGYGKYHLLYRWRWFLRWNTAVRRALAAMMNALPVRRGSPLPHLLGVRRPQAFLAVKNAASARWLETLPGYDEWCDELFEHADLPVELLARHFDLAHTMPSSFIPAIERASMRASLEVRTPFLHRPLLDLVSRMDQRAFFVSGQKAATRRILGRYLPPRLVDSGKIGFRYPANRFLESVNEAPVIPGLPGSKVSVVWQRRTEKGWRSLAVRLAVLSHVANSADPPAEDPGGAG